MFCSTCYKKLLLIEGTKSIFGKDTFLLYCAVCKTVTLSNPSISSQNSLTENEKKLIMNGFEAQLRRPPLQTYFSSCSKCKNFFQVEERPIAGRGSTVKYFNRRLGMEVAYLFENEGYEAYKCPFCGQLFYVFEELLVKP
jgi:hypothetical protein